MYKRIIILSPNVNLFYILPLQQAVVGVCAGMSARKSLEARILRQSKGQSILGAQLFQLGHYTIRDTWNTFCQEAIHHRFIYFKLSFNTKVYKIGIYKNLIEEFLEIMLRSKG
jgi:hypothetical protein